MKLPLSKLPPGFARFALAGVVALLWLLFAIGPISFFIPSFQPAGFLLYYPAIWLLLTLGLWLWIRRQEDLRSATMRELREAPVGLTMVITPLLVALALWVCLPASGHDEIWGRLSILFLAAVPLVLVCGLLIFFSWRRWHCTRFFLGLALAELLVLLWLCWDEAPVEPGSFAVAPADTSPRAAESDAILRWYCSFDGQPTTRTLTPPHLPSRLRPNTTGEWRLFVAAQRDIIRAEWDSARDVRAWVKTLDGFAAIGDIPGQTKLNRTRTYHSANRWYAVTQLYCAYASLLAIEGQAGAALDVLRPMLSVCRKLQPEASTLARYRCASQAQGACQDAVQFILRATPVSAPVLRTLAITFQPSPHAGEALRRVLIGEAGNASSAYLFLFTEWSGDATWLTFEGVGFLYLPHATHRLVLEQFSRLATVATEGRGEGLRAHLNAVDQALRTPAFKNAQGRLMAADAFRSSADFVRDAWRVEDQRRALLAEVQAKIAAAEKKDAAPPTATPKTGTP